MTSYLLGELSEVEQAALEAAYFSDPEVFERIVKAEHELVDNYVRGRLSPQARERFEQHYLAHPSRRERMKFAEALATQLDQAEGATALPAASSLQSWLETLRGPRWAFGFAVALALLLALAGAWLLVETRRLRQELAETQAARASQAQRERDLAQQAAEEQKRADQLAAEIARLRAESHGPTPPVSQTPAFVSLLLTVGGVRGNDAGQPQALVIPPGTEQVRLQLRLQAGDYSGYRAVLQAVSGGELFKRQGLKPNRTKSGAVFTFIVPASKFSAGDYLLTLQGVSQSGEVDELSKSLFRVEKK